MMVTKNRTKQNATSKEQSRPTCKFYYQCELIEKMFLSKIDDDPKRF